MKAVHLENKRLEKMTHLATIYPGVDLLLLRQNKLAF